MTREQIEAKAKKIADKMIDFANYSRFNTPDEQRNVIASVAKEAAMEMAEFALSHQWVSVEYQLPPHSESESNFVLIQTSFGYSLIGCFDYKTNVWRDENWYMIDYDITHWMPIPPLAEKGGNDDK